MAVDLDIFPTSKTLPIWGEIKDLWITLSPDQPHLAQKLFLKKLGSHTVVQEHERLVVGLSYYPELSINNTLGITAVSINGVKLSAEDFLQDYGRNLSADLLRDYTYQWDAAGYMIEITSFGGRSKEEPRLMVTLASAIAKSCAGYIIVSDEHIFGVKVGVYSPDVIATLRPDF